MINQPENTNDTTRRIGLPTATLLVVANMIGVGVFTTTGYMVADIGSGPAVLLAWIVGGIAAFCGALSYAEIGAALPRNGGEYQLLSRIYHPALGFVAGCTSLVLGFSAPLALFAMGFGKYLHAVVPGADQLTSGLVLIGVVSLVHILHVDAGNRFHNAFTLGKVALIVGFIIAGGVRCNPALIVSESTRTLTEAVLLPKFPVSLIFVSFAYNGWNAVSYLAGEIRRPERNIPLAVMFGTATVALLYFGLNFVFLAAAPAAELAGKAEVGHFAAVRLFGPRGAAIVSSMIMLGLVSTVSAIIMTGPRTYEAMSHDYPALRFLSIRRANGGPVTAILLQAILAAVMMLTASFETLLTYVGLTLSLFTALTVIGVFVLRVREPLLLRPYRTWGFPVTPLVCIALEVWMIVYTVVDKPKAAEWGAVTLVIGLVLYLILRATHHNPAHND